MKNSFLLYLEYQEMFNELTDEEAGKLIKAIFEYVKTGNINIDKYLKIIFIPIKNNIDRNKLKWEDTKKKRSEAGKKGMEVRWHNDITNDKNDITKITNDNKVINDITKITDNVNVNVNVNDNVNVNNIKKENIIKEKKYFENEELNDLFIEFLDLRKKIKAVNSERAINMLLNKLSKYDDETKKEMINQSIVNSWKDVYEIRVKKSSKEKMQDEINKFLGG